MAEVDCQVKIDSDLALCICTYKRPQLLRKLLGDLLSQSLLPGLTVIVDGDPASGQVLDMLRTVRFPCQTSLFYVASSHANLAYQRYLGWLATHDRSVLFFVYLDDDLRLRHRDAISRVVEPLTWKHEQIVGVTTMTKTGDIRMLAGEEILIARRIQHSRRKPSLIRYFGASRNTDPGDLSPSGHRKEPNIDSMGYAEVKWLYGRVMAYAYRALKQECFSEDLFAVTEINCGLGEDTFLSRRVGVSGKMLLISDAGFDHPDEALPNSYPIRAFEFGYATAYSRRLLNDDFRYGQSPTIYHRYSLVKSYLGTMFLNWINAFRGFQPHQIAYARGYTLGALRGLLQRPTATSLTPGINWWVDARKDLAQGAILQ